MTIHMLEIGAIILTPILGFIGSWGGVKAQMRAFHDSLAETKADVRELRGRVDRIRDRVFGVSGHG